MEDPRRHLSDSDKMVLERLCSAGKAWIVGGWVRDILSDIQPKEVDYATSLMPREVMQLFPRNIPVGERYGTILVLKDEKTENHDDQNEETWEITTLRKDGSYGDGRRPDNVDFGHDILEDLSRRDFTINSMAIDGSNGELIDPFSGLEDLKSGILRAVGDAKTRISEDGLRILRAFRFINLENGKKRNLDNDLSDAIRQNVAMLDNVSEERKWNEFSQIISSSNANDILESMEGHGVLSRILPGISISSVNEIRLSADSTVSLALLCNNDSRSGPDLASYLKSILKLSNEEENVISFLHDIPKEAIEEKNDSILRIFRSCISEKMQLKMADYFGPKGEEYLQHSKDLKPLTAGKLPLIDGEHLMEITGLEPGPRLGRLKDWLQRKQIEEDLGTKEDVLQLLETINWREEDPESWGSLSWP